MGDLLVILVGNGDATDSDQWDDTYKPTGFTLINELGDNTYDCHCAAFYRVVDGTEAESFSIPALTADYMWAMCLLISVDVKYFGRKPNIVLHQTGADSAVASAVLATPLVISAVTTTVQNTLGIFVSAFDGGDDGGFTCFDTAGAYPGWKKRSENHASTASAGASGVWGTKTIINAGTSGTASVYAAAGDGMVGFMFAFAESVSHVATDDIWANTLDDTWYGVGLTARIKTSRFAIGARRLPTPMAVFSNTTKSSGSKIGASRFGPLWAYIPNAVKTAGTKLGAFIAPAMLSIAAAVKQAGTKLWSMISTTTTAEAQAIELAVKDVGSKLGSLKPAIQLAVAALVKNAKSKIGSLKPLVWLAAAALVKNAKTKLSGKVASVSFAFSTFVKNAKSKLRSSLIQASTVFIGDNFGGTTLGPQWKTIGLGTISVTGGYLTIATSSAANTSVWQDNIDGEFDIIARIENPFYPNKWTDGLYQCALLARIDATNYVEGYVKYSATAGKDIIYLTQVKSGSENASSPEVDPMSAVVFRVTRDASDRFLLYYNESPDGLGAWVEWGLAEGLRLTSSSFVDIGIRAKAPTLTTYQTDYAVNYGSSIVLSVAVKIAKSFLQAAKNKIALSIYGQLKNAGSKLQSIISTITGAGTVSVTIKNAALKLGSSIPIIRLFFTSLVKTTRIKLQGRIFRLTLVIQSTVKNARTKLGAYRINQTLAISAAVKYARSKLRAMISITSSGVLGIAVKSVGTKIRSSVNLVSSILDWFKDTLDDFWVSTKDDEWLGRIMLTVRSVTSKLRSYKLTRPVYSVPAQPKTAGVKTHGRKLKRPSLHVFIQAKVAGVKIRAWKTSINLAYAVLSIVVKSAGTKIRAFKSTVSAAYQIIALPIKNASTRLRSRVASITFNGAWVFPIAARMKLRSDRFLGWTLDYLVTAARTKIAIKRPTFLQLLTIYISRLRARSSKPSTTLRIGAMVKSAGLKTGARFLSIVRRYTLAVKSAGGKIGATRISYILVNVILLSIKNAGVRIGSGISSLRIEMAALISNATMKLQAFKADISFSYAIWELAVKNAVLKIASTKPIISLFEAVFDIAVKTATIAMQSAAIIGLSFTAAVKTASVKIASPVVFAWAAVGLLIKNAGLKAASLKTTFDMVIGLAMKNAGLKLKSMRPSFTFTYAAFTLAVKTAGVKLRSLKPSFFFHSMLVRVKRARMVLGAMKPPMPLRVVALVKKAAVKVGSTLSIFSFDYFSLAVKNAGLKIGRRFLSVATGDVILTIRNAILKLGTTKPYASAWFTVGTKIARMRIAASRATTAYQYVWNALGMFVTRAIHYLFSSTSVGARNFESKAEVYRFVSKNR